MDRMSWLFKSAWRFYILAVLGLVTAPLTFAVMDGKGMFVGLRSAGLQAGGLVVSVLLVFGLRRAGRI